MALTSGFELVDLGDGLHTLRDLETGEKFHPVVGPMAEARAIHIAPLNLALRGDQPLVIWDVGLGAGANAVALIEELHLLTKPFHCEIVSFDRTLAPLQFALDHAEALQYPVLWKVSLMELIKNGRTMLETFNGGKIEWKLCLDNFTSQPEASSPDGIIYDPYSPLKNPAMWSLKHFTRLRERLTQPAILTSYSRSTAVRVTMLLAGFFVGIGNATGEKDQTSIAATDLTLLKSPLTHEWLDRVRRSTHSRPLGEGVPGPISQADLARLEAHPQFQ